MRAVRVHAPGGPEALRVEEVPIPSLKAGEVLVRVAAAGVNFVDIYQREGRYPLPLPFTAGQEGAGEVAAVASDVTGVAVGDRVAWASVQGGYAEYAAVPAARLVPLPEHVSEHDAAAALLQGMTAHYLALDTYAVQTGDWVLIHAGAGGVGLLLTQLAKRLLGAWVITTVSTEEKERLSRDAGADVVVRYTDADFVAEARKATGGAGVKAVYDSVGRTTFAGSLRCLAPRGTLALFGGSSGAVPPFDPMELSKHGSLFLTRPVLAHYIATRDDLLRRAGDVLDWLASGALTLRTRSYPLAEAARAHRDLEGRATAGKLLLIL